MSRPGSYHDSSHLTAGDTFSLPLFNPHQSTGPPPLPPPNRPIQTHGDALARLPPPPQSSGHQQRHSIHQQSPFASSSTGYLNGLPSGSSGSVYGGTGTGAGGGGGGFVPPPNRQSHSGGTGNLFSSPYTSGGRHEELMPPPTTSTSLGSLARSASLGARRKDPYAYSSDDVESGFGQMDVRGEGSYRPIPGQGQGQGQGQGYGHLARPSFSGGQAFGAGEGVTGVDVSMASPGGPRPYSSSTTSKPSMLPPPIPNQYSRPPPAAQNDSGGSSSASPGFQPYSPSAAAAQSSAVNPYIPRGSDPGPSIHVDDQLAGWPYSRPQSNQRMPSSSSFHTQSSEHRSPFHASDATMPSPHSPLLNPYDSSPLLSADNALSSPALSAGVGQGWPAVYPPSPPGSRPTQPGRSQSHQTYPASQPVTPAGKYEAGPRGARDQRSKAAPSRQGFRDIRDWSDLRPMSSDKANGRRADPLRPGKYLSPLQCLTSALPQTYQLCNSQFRYESSDNPRRVLTKPSKPAHNDGTDNEDWDYILYVNDVLGGEHGGDRYLILDVLGQGTFGQVVKCQNMRTHDICAVKVVKNKPAYLNQSKMEVAILDLLNNQYDPHDQHHILRMLESFTHRNHLCLVFECLSSNLYELIKQNQFKGLSTQLVKVFTQQLLECLAVLKDARLIHCDLKPENILLKSLQSPQIKIIDFGSACHEMQTVYTYIQSRFYRSPEVLLGLPYSTSIDMWSLGCIVVELFLGLPLFPGTSEYNQISRIVDMLGNPPGHLLDVGKQTHEFFNYVGADQHGRKQYKLKSLEVYSHEHRTNEQPSKQYFKQTKLRDIIMEYPIAKKNPKQSDVDKEMAHRRSFVDFVQGLLNLDPIKRWSPQQASKHPFITGEKFTSPFQPPSMPSRKTMPASAAPSPAPTSTAATANTPKKYGGLVQNPPAARNQRVFSDASAYSSQNAQQQVYNAQLQAQNQNAMAARPAPYASSYDPPPSAGHRARIPSQGQWQPMGPPQGNYQPRIPSSSMAASASQSALRQNQPMAINTNPPPNSYYPASRNRSSTINQMDVIPPALARLTHMSMPDPSGQRNLTPVLNRGDDPYREWERRQAGHAKKSSMHHSSYPQLEYLQEQAELAAMGGSWMMPGQYAPAMSTTGGVGGGGGGGAGHRSRPSTSGQYQMQPHIGVSPTSPGGPPGGYRPHNTHSRQASEYDLPLSAAPNSAPSASSARPYLPAFPPPAATSSLAPAAPFDPFDSRDSGNMGMGMMYSPLQPSVAYSQHAQHQHPGYANPASHQTRASFSGPYGPGLSTQAHLSQQQQQQQLAYGQAMQHAHAQGQGQAHGQGQTLGGPQSPRNQRRSQQYNV